MASENAKLPVATLGALFMVGAASGQWSGNSFLLKSRVVYNLGYPEM